MEQINSAAGPTASALLIVDVQRALFGGHFEAYDGDEVVYRIAALRERAHAQGAPVIYLRHRGPDGSPMEPGSDG